MNKASFFATVKRVVLVNLVASIFVILMNMTNGWEAAFSRRRLTFSFVYSFCIGSVCSIVISYVSPKIYDKSLLFKVPIYVITIFAAVYCGLLLGNTLAYVTGIIKISSIFPLSPQILLFPLSIGLVFGGAVFFYEQSQQYLLQTQAKFQQKEIEESHAKRLATEAQLASLESRIHPHFLFNTLNSIAALIRENPVLAEKTVEKFSALLRYSLDSNVESLVSLRQEIDVTEKYLEIEKIRFESRLNYKITCEPEFWETRIPPLSLQTLVENSIKHVVAKTSEQTEILVSVKENGEKIEIEVFDNGKGFAKDDLLQNHGLDLLRKRLNATLSYNADLQITEKGKVSLLLPK